MLNIKDVRTGNWVNDKSGNAIQVDMDWFISSEEVGVPLDFNLQGYTPIPITTNWLLRFGFQNHSDDWYHIKLGRQSFDLVYDKEMNDWSLKYQSDIGGAIQPTEWSGNQYVHWLQNRVYYLSQGEELEIKV